LIVMPQRLARLSRSRFLCFRVCPDFVKFFT
jgi:hypothetical protein